MARSSIVDDGTTARAMAKRAFDLSKDLPREEALFIEGRYRELTRSWPAAVPVPGGVTL